MPKKITKNKWYFHKRLQSIVAIGLFAGVGAYLVFFTQAATTDPTPIEAYFIYADPVPGNPGFDPSYVKGSQNTIENAAAVGDMVLPVISIHTPSSTNSNGPGRFTVVTTFYYPSSYVHLNSVHCEKNTRCIVVTWPKFQDSTVWDDRSRPDVTYTDRKVSVCTDRPNRNPNAPFAANEDRQLFAPKFIVTNSSDAFPIYAVSHAYQNAACDVNGGQIADNPGEHTSGNCFNRLANKSAGGGGIGVPSQCGLGVQGGGNPGIDTPGVEGGLGSGNNTNGNNGNNNGNNGNGPSSSGGGGGSSAETQGNSPNTIPSSSTQGDNSQPELEPSPFFDGKQYEPGSDPDILGLNTTFSIAGRNLKYGWLYIVILIIVGGAGYYVWKKKPGILKKLKLFRFSR